MTKQVSAFQWQPIVNTQDYAATIPCDTTIDNTWQVGCNATVDDQGRQIAPTHALVDNMANGALCTFQYGPFSFQVPAFTRKLFRLPIPTNYVTLNGTSGTILIIFVTNPNWVVEDANLLAIQEAATAGPVTYPFVVYNAVNSPQQTADFQRSVELAPVAANMNYNLLGIAANTLANGDFQYVYNTGSKIAYLTPAGGDTLNTLFSNALPFALYPGEAGWLVTDGAQWFFEFATRKRPTIATALASLTQSSNDDGKRLRFSGAVVQTYSLLPAGNYVNGFMTRLRNDNTAGLSMLIAPNGADTINGVAASAYLAPGDEAELFIGDTGQWNLRILERSGYAQAFNAVASGSIVVPAGFTEYEIVVTAMGFSTNNAQLYGLFHDTGVGDIAVNNMGVTEQTGGVTNTNTFSARAQWEMTKGASCLNNDFTGRCSIRFSVTGLVLDATAFNVVQKSDNSEIANWANDRVVATAGFDALKLKASAGNITFNSVIRPIF